MTLSGPDLDAAVARALGYGNVRIEQHGRGMVCACEIQDSPRALRVDVLFQPSASWLDGGPLIERERIDLRHIKKYKTWTARIDRRSASKPPILARGPTPLIAACRALVASKEGK